MRSLFDWLSYDKEAIDLAQGVGATTPEGRTRVDIDELLNRPEVRKTFRLSRKRSRPEVSSPRPKR